MKTFITSLLLISSSAFAYNTEPEVNYISWCSDNQVMTRNRQGNVIVLADCTNGASEYFTCTEKVLPKGQSLIVTASCKRD